MTLDPQQLERMRQLTAHGEREAASALLKHLTRIQAFDELVGLVRTLHAHEHHDLIDETVAALPIASEPKGQVPRWTALVEDARASHDVALLRRLALALVRAGRPVTLRQREIRDLPWGAARERVLSPIDPAHPTFEAPMLEMMQHLSVDVPTMVTPLEMPLVWGPRQAQAWVCDCAEFVLPVVQSHGLDDAPLRHAITLGRQRLKEEVSSERLRDALQATQRVSQMSQEPVAYTALERWQQRRGLVQNLLYGVRALGRRLRGTPATRAVTCASLCVTEDNYRAAGNAWSMLVYACTPELQASLAMPHPHTWGIDRFLAYALGRRQANG